MAPYSLMRPWTAGSWGDLDALRREMDTLFNRFSGASPVSSGWRGVYPAVNLYETSDAYVLTAELPGVDPEAIHVSLEGSTVSLSGERSVDYRSGERVSLHRRERQSGSFRRAFELPAIIDADKVEAVHRNGVLMLRLPKSEEHQPRQISIRTS